MISVHQKVKAVDCEYSLFRLVRRACEREPQEKNGRAESWGEGGWWAARSFLSRHARRTKRKRDYSWSEAVADLLAICKMLLDM